MGRLPSRFEARPCEKGGDVVAGKARPTTLQSIADRLGLHVSTVSRVLNGSTGDGGRAASSRTAQRIRELAHDLGYRPNPYATSLRTQRSNLIGVLVPRLSDPVLAFIYEGVEDAATDHGLSTFVTNTQDDARIQEARTNMALDRRVDGLIFADGREDTGLLDRISAQEIPFVLVNRHVGDHPAITCDNRLGGRLVAEHFLERGYENVAVIAGPSYASTAVDRTAGFTARYEEAGITIPESMVVESAFDTAGGRRAAERILRGRTAPIAIFAVNDFAAIGAAGCARDHGLMVGTDIAIAGFNDTPLAPELPVPLTSVRTPVHEMGRGAVEMLVRLLAGNTAESRLLPPALVIRESSLLD
ncbi:LacI family DNA-binding transcriptional regulator [Streptosporangium sp. CA-135522]|uniref:LacI family DNA-binding transcriptional regulator n=1 Tax=Streptosporangium sp. CA-135522 TaxID=3240072 RepID=UPI003D927060